MMPDLIQTLQGNDLSFLRMVAGVWGIELEAGDAFSAVPQLVAALQDQKLVAEVVDSLPFEARQALKALVQNEGRMPWSLFCRRFGEMRVMGAARRDRERPDLNPVTPSEMLWYRALVGKVFMNLPPEPQEFAYIPDDMIDLLQFEVENEDQPLGHPASPLERVYPILADDHILDEACTLLAALRCGRKDMEKMIWKVPLAALGALLRSAGLLGGDGLPSIEMGRAFLEAPRGEALAKLVRGWINSKDFNELRLLPGLRFEGNWMNDPLQARQAFFGLLSKLPQQTWWSLTAFIAAIKERQPDFQRPAGDYDSWFIYKESNGAFLRGFSSWEDVDGSLLRFFITGPLHWLGLYDLASEGQKKEPVAFRPSAWADALWHDKTPTGLRIENGSVQAGINGRLRLSATVPRAVRYQLARFCVWEEATTKEYCYRLTPGSLERARQQGLEIKHLITLLRKSTGGQIPPTLLQALERWERLGFQTSLEKVILLRVASKEMIANLSKTRAGRFLGEKINDTMVIIKPGGEGAVRDALAECGYLPDSRLEEL
jgi:hypothetical protein